MTVPQPGRNSHPEAPDSGAQPRATHGSTKSGLGGEGRAGQGAGHSPPRRLQPCPTQSHCQAAGPTGFTAFMEIKMLLIKVAIVEGGVPTF